MTLIAVVPVGSYRGVVVSGDAEGSWPQVGWELLAELATDPGRLALIAGNSLDGYNLALRLARDLGLDIVWLGAAVSALPGPPSEGQLYQAVGEAELVADVDLLFSADLGIDPLGFLAQLARRRPTVAVWPGEVVAGRARYSVPGRPDHFDRSLPDAIVLRPRPVRYPDEVPFSLERTAR